MTGFCRALMKTVILVGGGGGGDPAVTVCLWALRLLSSTEENSFAAVGFGCLPGQLRVKQRSEDLLYMYEQLGFAVHVWTTEDLLHIYEQWGFAVHVRTMMICCTCTNNQDFAARLRTMRVCCTCMNNKDFAVHVWPFRPQHWNGLDPKVSPSKLTVCATARTRTFSWATNCTKLLARFSILYSGMQTK